MARPAPARRRCNRRDRDGSLADVIAIATRLPGALEAAGRLGGRMGPCPSISRRTSITAGAGDRPGLLDLAALGGRGWAGGRLARPGARRRHVVRRGDVRDEAGRPASDVELRRLGAEVA
jgi:hypothetical protein